MDMNLTSARRREVGKIIVMDHSPVRMITRWKCEAGIKMAMEIHGRS